MDTAVEEIAPDIFRLSTWIPDITDQGFTMNQFLLTGDEPFLFHCGQRQLFPLVSQAIARVVPLETLRWISFAHVEADECGAVNLMLAGAPNVEVIHGSLACTLSLTDLCDRPPVAALDDGVHDTGGHRLRFIPTPHIPHNWESGLWFDEATGTLLAGDRRGADFSRDGSDVGAGAQFAPARRLESDHAGADARSVVQWRRRRAAARAGRRVCGDDAQNLSGT